MSWILYVEVLKNGYGTNEIWLVGVFCHVGLEIIGLMNSGKFNMVSTHDINVDHGIE
jgi:hypothetical protein